MSLRRIAASALSTAFIVSGLVAGAAGTAAADTTPTCKAESCFTKDPIKTNCYIGAYIVLQGTAFGGTANLWWSPACEANWLQYDVPDSQHQYGLILEGSGGDMTAFQTTVQGWAWTDMVASPGPATMCIDRYDLNGRNQQDGGCWTQSS